MRKLLCSIGLLAQFLTGAPVTAHEFWIDPAAFQIDSGENLVADLRVGQNFSGSAYSYIPNNFKQFYVAIGDATFPVEGRMGDRPALNMPAPATGLAVVVHQTTVNKLNYSEWEKFQNFVKHKAFDGLPQAHLDRGLPQAGFQESYDRYAKSLIAVGEGRGMDRAVGLETEIVALANPYTDDLGDGLPVKVLYQGAPRANAQVEIFDRPPQGDVVVTTTRTDDSGVATIPVQAGHTYLLDAVVLRDTGTDVPETGPVWHSLWAALTFAVPAE